MSIEDNKKVVLAFYKAIESMNFDLLHDMVHEDFVFYAQKDTPCPGVEGLVASEKAAFASYDSFKFPVVHMVAEGDMVAAYMHFIGHGYNGGNPAVPANGRSCTLSLMHLLTFKDGKIIEKRAHYDNADALRQISG
jgi:predicted ester cyclase